MGRIVRESGAKFLLQGTILTDVDETVAGIKRQHNVFAQLGIDPQQAFGYQILEPLIELRKDGVRMVGKALGLPIEMFDRIPFPGPALAARIIGEVTAERLETVRKATAIVEELLKDTGAFQYMAILHEDRVTGMRDGKRDFLASRLKSAAGIVSMQEKPRQPDCHLKHLRNWQLKSWIKCLELLVLHIILHQSHHPP